MKLKLVKLELRMPDSARTFYSLGTLLPLLAGGGGWLSPALAKAINLTVFILLFYFLVRKPIRQAFAHRLTGVRELLQRAALEKEAAVKKMAELNTRLDRLDDELSAIRGRTVEEAAAERARIEAETERDIARLRQTARNEIETARQVALSDLRNFAAIRSVDLAEQMIRQEMTPADDGRLIRRVGEELTKVN